jgi:hypothetical protein
MGSIDYDTDSLSGGSIARTVDSSCYSENSQPRICPDMSCTFPFGDMCKVCRLDRAVRKTKVSKSAREKQAKEWVKETNVQKYIMKYTGQVFFGGALDRDVGLEQEEPLDTGDDEEDDIESEEYDEEQYYESDREDQPAPSDSIPSSFASDWDIHPDLSSVSQRTSSSSTAVSSRLSIQSDLTAYLEPWTSDLFDRTLEGQMEDTIFVGGAGGDSDEIICPLCREPVSDPTYQHLLRCQFAHDEQERMEALWRR